MNIIWQFFQQEQRNLKWLCEKHKLSYERFRKFRDLTNTELAQKLTFQEVEDLEKTIKNIKSELKPLPGLYNNLNEALK